MISVVIPLYNKQAYIAHTIKSVISQPTDNYEVIVVNDGSTDKSLEIAQSFESDCVHVFTKSNGGPASSRNYGIKRAHGEWIMILDGDDIIEPNILLHYEGLIQAHSRCNFFCCNHYIEEKGRKRLYSETYTKGYLINNFFSWCTGGLMPVAGACIIKRELLLKYPFREDLRRYEDAESLFNIFREAKIFRSPKASMTYNRNASSASFARKNINEDFIGHLQPRGKSWWEQCAIFDLYIQGCYLYPEQINELYRYEDFHTFGVKVCNRLRRLLKRIGYI